METRAEPLGFLLESDWIEVKKMEATRGLRPTASQVAASLGILQEGSSIVFERIWWNCQNKQGAIGSKLARLPFASERLKGSAALRGGRWRFLG